MKKVLLSFLFLLIVVTVQAQAVYKTKTGSKYHVSNCRYLKSSITVSLQDALGEGLTACSICRPGGGSAVPNRVTPAASSLVEEKLETAESPNSDAVQCSGITKAGTRCRRMTKASNGRCYQH